MENVLLSSEIDLYVETMKPQDITALGGKGWLEWHKRLQQLNQQALLEASNLREETVKEALVSFRKVPILVHEAILINVWKYKVLPKLLKLQPCPKSTFIAYSVLYHEAIAVALLELVLYHATCFDNLEDTSADLLDYSCGLARQLLSGRHEEPRTEESSKEELLRQRDNLNFEIGIRTISIVRYLAECLDRMPLSLVHSFYSTYDIPVLFTELIIQRPWIKNGRQFVGGRWREWDGEALGQSEAQVWLTLRHLLLDKACLAHYFLTESRRTQLVKLLKYMTPVLLDQLAPLIELKTWLSRATVGQLPNAPSNKPILLENVLAIKEGIVNACGGKWKTLARNQLEVIFCEDREALVNSAQMLNEAFNTDLLEKLDVENTDKICEQCGKNALQRCSRCKNTWYCSRGCQVVHWTMHKDNCLSAI